MLAALILTGPRDSDKITRQRGETPSSTQPGTADTDGAAARLSAFLSSRIVDDLTGAGELLASADTSDLVDASVVSGALQR